MFGPRFTVADRVVVDSNALSYTECVGIPGLHEVITLDKMIFTPMMPVVVVALVLSFRHVLLSAAEVVSAMLVAEVDLVVMSLSVLVVLLKGR